MKATIKIGKKEIEINNVESYEMVKKCIASCRIMTHSGPKNVLSFFDNENVLAKLTFSESKLSGIKCFDETNKRMLLIVFALKEVYSKNFFK